MPRRIFHCICNGCAYKTNHSRNLLRHLKGRSHRAGDPLLERARLYVKGGEPPIHVTDPLTHTCKSPADASDPPTRLSVPPLPQVCDSSTQTEACCADCLEELVAVRMDNSEYRDYYPTPELMVAAAERLDAFEAAFNSPAEVQAYLKRIAREHVPGVG